MLPGALRLWYSCPGCRLLFVAPSDHLPPEEERARYDEHENDPVDPAYRSFLDRLARPLSERLEPGARGLDYGSGPGPTLSVIMEERGFPMEIWDPFYAPDPTPLHSRYDFVTCTETAEHFHRPQAEFDTLAGLVKPGGWLALMTGVPGDDVDLQTWHYGRDPTHVCLYREVTLRWLAGKYGWALERPSQTVALFRTG